MAAITLPMMAIINATTLGKAIDQVMVITILRVMMIVKMTVMMMVMMMTMMMVMMRVMMTTVVVK